MVATQGQEKEPSHRRECEESGHLPIMWRVRPACSEGVRAFLLQQADLNQSRREAWKCLHEACQLRKIHQGKPDKGFIYEKVRFDGP